MHILRQLKRFRPAVMIWRLVKKTFRATPYYVLRLIGHSTFPILGPRVPLRGYYSTTREFLRHGNGYCADLTPLFGTDEAWPSDEFKFQKFVAVIPRARSLYECGIIVSPDHKLLADVSWCGYDQVSQPRHHPVMNKACFPPIHHIPGAVAIISSVEANNYYHWMFDILPRFEILQRSGLVPDYYYVNTKMPFQRQSLQLLRISSSRILSPTKGTHIEAAELIVPSLLGPAFCHTPKAQACKYLQSIFVRKNEARRPYRKLYVSRSDANSRRVINEAEICEEVLDNGFEVISLSGVLFSNKWSYSRKPKLLWGPTALVLQMQYSANRVRF